MEPLLGASGWRQEQAFPPGTLSLLVGAPLAPNVGRMMDEHFPTVGTGESILLWISLEGLRAREVLGRSCFCFVFLNFHLKKKLHEYMVDPKVCLFCCITYYASPIILFIV